MGIVSINEKTILNKITIITVVYNAEKTLEQTIQSVINQTYPNIEYIVIDGGSTDLTKDIIKKYQKNISYWVSEPDKGIYDAMNKGLKAAQGDWVFFLGADDILIDEIIIENIAVRFTKMDVIYYGNAKFKSTGKIYDVNLSKWFLCIKNISHQTIFYPKLIYKNYSYNLKYKLFSDHVYNIQLFTANTFQFIHLPLTTVLYNDAGSSASANDPLYFADLPTILWNSMGKRYAIYVYFRFAFFLFKRRIVSKLR